jgi:hypothetical protein
MVRMRSLDKDTENLNPNLKLEFATFDMGEVRQQMAVL